MGPEFRELAERRMKELNEAYEVLAVQVGDTQNHRYKQSTSEQDEKTTESKGASGTSEGVKSSKYKMQMKLKYFYLIMTLASISAATFMAKGNTILYTLDTILYILGRATGLLACPAIVVGIAFLVRKRRLSSNAHMGIFLVAWFLIVFFNIIAVLDEAGYLPQSNSTSSSALNTNDMVHHRDEANGFAIWYPKTWAKVPATYAAVKLKVVSKSGAGSADFSVVVVSDPAFKNITGERLVEMILDSHEAMLAQLRKDFPDAKVIKSGKTHLDSKPAYYVIFDSTFRSFDLEFPIRYLVVSAVYKSRAYNLTSRAGPDEFDDMKPIFTLIMGGFKILQR